MQTAQNRQPHNVKQCAHGVIVTPGIGCVRSWFVVILCWPTKAKCVWCRYVHMVVLIDMQ